ncbi:MAG: hypothetical protein JRI23_31455, partial [Deltaproteobacteria bacterium]|nr:hypothetical protein [Deltaproteobacteria bacterium]MBW2536733.1 hypothetical protein [Deltaproteobacteria bacterium]
ELTCVQVAPAEPIPGHSEHFRHERWAVIELPESCCPLCDDAPEHPTEPERGAEQLLN